MDLGWFDSRPVAVNHDLAISSLWKNQGIPYVERVGRNFAHFEGIGMHFAMRVNQTATKDGLEDGGISVPGKSSLGFAAVILAAGASPKKEKPISLNLYLGRTLVEHVARSALAAGACEVVVVAGEHAEEIRRKLRRLPVRVIQNREWRDGIASSIRAGISHLTDKPAAAIVCLCDQPRITSEHLRALGERVLAPDGAYTATRVAVPSSLIWTSLARCSRRKSHMATRVAVSDVLLRSRFE